MDGIIAVGNVSDEQLSVLRFAMLQNGYHPHVFGLSVDTPPPTARGSLVVKRTGLVYRSHASSREILLTDYKDLTPNDMKAFIWASDISDEQRARMGWLTKDLPAGFIDYTVCIERYGTCRLKGKACGTLYVT